MEIADIESEFDDLKSYVNEIDCEDLESRITELEDKIENLVQVINGLLMRKKVVRK